MAGEIAQEVAIMLAIGSATIGASGAIVSQVVAGVITGKREQRKADAEAERWKLEADAKRRDRQLDRKIELFGKFLSTSQELLALQKKEGQEATEQRQNAVTKLGSMSEEIGIHAPELYLYARSTYHAALVAILTIAIGKPTDSEGHQEFQARRTRASLEFWTRAFRESTRLYVSHEPIQDFKAISSAHDKAVERELAKAGHHSM
jgi:hypothetical protein